MCFKKEYQIEKENEKGIREYVVESWRGFCQLVDEEFAKDDKKSKPCINNYVWRGHRRENWGLVSYFDREFQKHYKKCYEEKGEKFKNNLREYILKRHSNSFAYACRNKLGEFGIKMREFLEFTREKKGGENFWWALGQHYELATPMLDWCCSTFVAAFFAFEEENKLEDINWVKVKDNERLTPEQKEEIVKKFKKCLDKANKEKFASKILNEELTNFFKQQRVVWGLNLQITNLRKKLVPQITYFDPMSSEYPRLINQRGVFTIADDGEDIRYLVQKRWKKDDQCAPWLIKIKIDNNDKNREDFLRGLDLMNINRMILFPDIYGAAYFSNVGIEFNDYARFHGQGPKVEDDPRKICE